MMLSLLRIALLIALAATFGLRAAHADIYTWVDASGALNVSNLAPPDDAKVLKVVHTDDAAAQKAETQALADRVKQLENQVAAATSQPPPMNYAPPPVVYAPPAPPVVQYIIQAPQPAPQYVVDQAPPDYSYQPCDPSWYGCSFGWPGYYPSGVVVVSTPPFRNFKPGFGRGFRPQPSPHSPMQTSLIQPLAVPFIQPLVPARQTPVIPTQPSFHRG
ncbi:MAG TPA: hypothetical protein VMU79_02550 [Casimicrobiaceae bacterium]|jgi:hypothetical protein|nr:hypothetical protein [Casimicrobiaceae bacterium]